MNSNILVLRYFMYCIFRIYKIIKNTKYLLQNNTHLESNIIPLIELSFILRNRTIKCKWEEAQRRTLQSEQI